MKKKLFFLAVAAVALASCSNDETIASQATSQANEISFRPLVNGITRTAHNMTATEVQSQGFNVTAITNGTSTAYFTAADYTWNSTSSTYTCATKYYWPSEGSLDFYAYSPISDTYVGTDKQIVKTDYKTFDITPSATPGDQVDFVYANTNAKTKGTDGKVTTLNFRHAESNIVIQLKNTSTDLKFTVKDVAIGYILPTAQFAYTGSTNGTTPVTNTDAASGYYLTGWGTPSGTRTSYSQTAGTTSYAAGAGASALSNNMILIPQTIVAATTYVGGEGSDKNEFHGAYISVELKIQDASNHYIAGTSSTYVTAMWPLTAITWLPGHKYTYTVDLKGGGYYTTNQIGDNALDPILGGAEIQFASVSVDEWNSNFVDVPTLTFDASSSTSGTYTTPAVTAGTYTVVVKGLTSGTYTVEKDGDGIISNVSTSDLSSAVTEITISFTVSGTAGNQNIFIKDSGSATKFTLNVITPAS